MATLTLIESCKKIPSLPESTNFVIENTISFVRMSVLV